MKAQYSCWLFVRAHFGIKSNLCDLPALAEAQAVDTEIHTFQNLKAFKLAIWCLPQLLHIQTRSPQLIIELIALDEALSCPHIVLIDHNTGFTIPSSNLCPTSDKKGRIPWFRKFYCTSDKKFNYHCLTHFHSKKNPCF